MNVERRRSLESFRKGPAMLTAALRQFPRKMWVYKHASDGLSIHDTVCRMADNEVIEYLHCRALVADPDFVTRGMASMEWSGSVGYFYQNVTEAVRSIRALRQFTYRFLEKLPEEVWTRAAAHQISLEGWLANRECYYPKQIRGMERIYYGWLEVTWPPRALIAARQSAGFESFASQVAVAQDNP